MEKAGYLLSFYQFVKCLFFIRQIVDGAIISNIFILLKRHNQILHWVNATPQCQNELPISSEI